MHRACSEFFGIPYDAKGFDCVALALAVQRKLYGRGCFVPGDRMEARRQQLAIFRTYLEETTDPQPGDVVLMREAGRHKADHVGTWFIIGGEACVLHTTERTDTVFTRIRLLSDMGLTVEGTYKWQT